MERILEFGGPEACRWLFDRYGRDRVIEFLRSAGARRLTPRALNYWALVLDLEDRGCLTASCLASRSPHWIG